MLKSKISTSRRVSWYNDVSTALNRVLPSLVHDYVNQRYYNSADGETAFPFTSVRTTNAMQFDSRGRLIWAPANLCPQSENFASASWAVSGGGGTKTTGVEDPNGGTAACTFTASGVNAVLQLSTGSGVVGQNYTVTMWLRRRTGSGIVQIRAIESVNTTVEVTTSWQKFSIAATATATTFRVGINLTTSGDAVDIAFPQAEVTGPNSPSVYISTGSSASNFYGARFDYDPLTLAPRGILIEESRTNLQPISQGSTSDWTANFGTLTNTGATIAGNAAYTFTTTSIGSGQFAYITTNAGTLSASTVYTSSIRVKKGNHPRVQFTVTNNCFLPAATDAYANYNFDTDTLTVAGSASPTGTRTIYADGSVLLTLTYTTGSAPTAGSSGIICLIDSNTSTRLAGTGTNGATVHVLGVQIEAASNASTYIPTYGSTAIRANDVLNMSVGSWLDQTKGTVYVSAVTTNGTAASRRMVALSDGTANNAISLIRSTASVVQTRTAVAGVSSFSPSTTNTCSNFVPIKVATVLNSPTKKVILDGGTVSTASVAFNTSGYTTLDVGREAGGSNYWMGWIKEIRYYADASASDAQLQALTQSYTVLAASPVVVPSTFAGMVVENVGSGNNTATTPWSLGVDYGIHRLLGQGTYWAEIETSDNVFDWNKMDAAVNAAYAAGKEIMWNVAYTPTVHASNVNAHRSSGESNSGGWAAAPFDLSSTMQTYPTLNSAKWGRFIQTAVTRYAGKIKYYVMWNEPNYRRYGNSGLQEVPHGNWFDTSDTGDLTDLVTVRTSVSGNQNYTQFVRMQADLYGIVHALDPAALVLGPDFFGEASSQGTGGKQDGVTCFASWLASGGASYCDGYSWHAYMDEGTGIDGVSKRLVSKLDALETARVSAGAASKSWYNTETGHEQLASLSVSNQNKWLGRHLIIAAAKGWKSWVMYVWDSANSSTEGMSLWGFPSSSSPGLRSIGTEFDRLATIINGATITNAVIYSDGTVVATINGVVYTI